ncbi:MAG: ATP-dependent helicase [Christensenellaceae bacterium]|nr:ATP-dependent helicase [Christensenellaceae bacterium]
MDLTQRQKEIVTAPLGAMLVTAGAGSGKTRTLTGRFVHLIKNGIDPNRILALTFTNKAGKEMRSRVELEMRSGEAASVGNSQMRSGDSVGQTRSGYGIGEDETSYFNDAIDSGRIGVNQVGISTFIGTFHSFCMRFLQRNHNSHFSIYDDNDSRKVLREVIKQVLGDDSDARERKEVLAKAEKSLAKWKNVGGSIPEYFEPMQKLILTNYEKQLEKNNAFDFDDLLLKTLEILRNNEEIREKMQKRFDCILIDEFQDTNKIQYDIISILAKVHRNIMIVGDEDQCIYTWRGASINNIERFKLDFPELKIYKLEENFRSCRNIVELANTLVKKNCNRIDKTLFSVIPDGEIDICSYWTDNLEADGVIQRIIENKRMGIGYGENAILMRMNALSRTFEERLRRYAIPYVIWGGFKFYDRQEIKIALDYLKTVVNPLDDVAFYNVINYPRRGIGETSIEKIKASRLGNHGKDLIGKPLGLDLSPNIKKSYYDFLEVLDNLKRANTQGLFYLAENFLKITGLDKIEDEDRLANLYQLMVSIKEFAVTSPELDLSYYLQTVAISSGDNPDADNSVILSTIHSAKGLEFKNVFIVGLEEGLFPVFRAFNNDDDMEEERRLFYVAITRARERLFISFATNRYKYGERQVSQRSRFLDDM